MASVVTRGNTVSLSFTFKDANGDAANVASASVQLVFPGRDNLQAENITLTENSGAWEATWDSSVSRGGWIEFHAHAIASGNPSTSYVEDGRFKLIGNRAGLQHDVLPQGGNEAKEE